MKSTKTLTFKVSRKNTELIAPAKQTPHEFKILSDIDDQENLRFNILVIQFYRTNPSAEGKDPVDVIRSAIAKALVFYYPLAGRLRERAARKLVVECTGEGIMFIEADADVTLQQFGGNTLQPPFPCLEELLYDVPVGVVDSPLLLIQVTRLKCGGFIVGTRLNHIMGDAAGLVQFMSAVGEFARGAGAPSIQPIWERHLLNARNPPRVTCTHHEYDDVDPDILNKGDDLIPPGDVDLVHRYFYFGATEFSAIRSNLPPHLRRCSTFELLAACLWRCRTISISLEPNEEVRILLTVNSRRRFSPPLPEGYYGNVIASPAAISTAGDLSKNPLHYAVELVRKAKSGVTEEYMRSMVDMIVIRGGPPFMMVNAYVVSDVTHAGFEQVDFGWGNAVFGGPIMSSNLIGVASFFSPCKNDKGENGVVVPISLPANAMDVFVKEIERILKCGGHDDGHTTAMAADRKTAVFISSAM